MSKQALKQRERQVPKGEVLFRSGEPGDTMYVIRAGKVRVAIETTSGEMRTLAVMGPGDFLGEMSVLTGQPRSAWAIVEEDATLLVVDAATLEHMVLHNTEIALRLLKRLAARLQQADALIQVLLHTDIRARIVTHIKHLAQRHKNPGDNSARIPVDYPGVAHQVGADVSVVRAILGRLENAGFLQKQQGAWYVANVDDIDDFLHFLRLKEQFN